MVTMRHESSVTSLSWIPSEAISGAMRVPFDTGLAHYDAAAGRIASRTSTPSAKLTGSGLANRLAAFIEVRR